MSQEGERPGGSTSSVVLYCKLYVQPLQPCPAGNIRGRQAEFFVGGSAELADLAYLTTPSGFNGKILNKYGFKTEGIGAIKVRIRACDRTHGRTDARTDGRGSSRPSGRFPFSGCERLPQAVSCPA